MPTFVKITKDQARPRHSYNRLYPFISEFLATGDPIVKIEYSPNEYCSPYALAGALNKSAQRAGLPAKAYVAQKECYLERSDIDV